MKTIQLNGIAIAIAILALVLTACATIKKYPNVTVYGSGIDIERVSDHVLEAGVPQVIVFGQSTSSQRRAIRYRALWKDTAGRPIKTTVSNWQEMTVDRRRPFTLEFVGPGDRARGYNIEIEVLEQE